jgi:serine/threonine-protein kinase
MEFADGGNLLQYLTAPMAPSVAAPIVLALVGAVQESHRNGVIHRDVKPENVLLKDGQVKLTDFGLAKGHESMLLTMGGQGTPGYMAPEQAVGPAIAASDVFGVGATLFHMLTAVRPPPGTVDLDPAALVVGCPHVLASLVLRMTHQDPKERPTLDLVAAALRGYLASIAPKAPPPRPSGPSAAQTLGGVALFGIVLMGLSKLLGGGGRR